MANEKRLIDANAFAECLERMTKTAYPNLLSGLLEAIDFVKDFPPVDAVQVVHGRWEKASETMPIYKCSICGERNLFKNGNNVLSNYCPHCGADMRGNNNG